MRAGASGAPAGRPPLPRPGLPPLHHRPAADNGRAVHAYAALGFRPVGLMRAYERRADGRWHDNLLMDLLADELVEP